MATSEPTKTAHEAVIYALENVSWELRMFFDREGTRTSPEDLLEALEWYIAEVKRMDRAAELERDGPPRQEATARVRGMYAQLDEDNPSPKQGGDNGMENK